MRVKSDRMMECLSDEEHEALRRLCRCSCSNQDIPGECADRLLQLNLAEMTCGGLGPTAAGRRLAAASRDRLQDRLTSNAA